MTIPHQGSLLTKKSLKHKTSSAASVIFFCDPLIYYSALYAVFDTGHNELLSDCSIWGSDYSIRVYCWMHVVIENLQHSLMLSSIHYTSRIKYSCNRTADTNTSQNRNINSIPILESVAAVTMYLVKKFCISAISKHEAIMLKKLQFLSSATCFWGMSIIPKFFYYLWPVVSLY